METIVIFFLFFKLIWAQNDFEECMDKGQDVTDTICRPKDYEYSDFPKGSIHKPCRRSKIV